MNLLAAYRKSITALVGSVITWAGVAYVPDGHVTRVEWYGLVVALATTAGVWAVANASSPATAFDPQPVELTAAGSVPLQPAKRARTRQGRFTAPDPVCLDSD